MEWSAGSALCEIKGNNHSSLKAAMAVQDLTNAGQEAAISEDAFGWTLAQGRGEAELQAVSLRQGHDLLCRLIKMHGICSGCFWPPQRPQSKEASTIKNNIVHVTGSAVVGQLPGLAELVT